MEQIFLDGALSKDGFITDQSKCQNIPYGLRTSDANGCGWIAAYNFCRATGYAVSVREATRGLLRFSLLRALAGTRCLLVYGYLRSLGYRLKLSCGEKDVIRAAETAQAGILFYRHSDGWHFVCLLPAGQGRLRFLNGWTGPRDPVKTMEAFIRENVKSKFLLTMTI